MASKHIGSCFCGAVTVEVTGEPEAMGYCHCASCRTWSAGPVNAFSLWKPANVKVTRGAEHLGKFQKSPTSIREFCTRCGGHLMTEHPTFGLTDVYAAILPTLAFRPALHVSYAETVMPLRDGLPKLKDFPAELERSGLTVPEQRRQPYPMGRLHEKLRGVLSVPVLIVLGGCAGMNPNPGERTADMAWTSGDFARAVTVVRPAAERGEPWAQLRLGIFYQNGWGVEPDPRQAMLWYEKVLAQDASGAWAEGQMVGAVGRSGYFNQHSDALIARFNLAQMLYKGEGIPRDLPRAYDYVSVVIEKAAGQSVFFCCEFAGGRYFQPSQFDDLKASIEEAMTPAERAQAEAAPDPSAP